MLHYSGTHVLSNCAMLHCLTFYDCFVNDSAWLGCHKELQTYLYNISFMELGQSRAHSERVAYTGICLDILGKCIAITTRFETFLMNCWAPALVQSIETIWMLVDVCLNGFFGFSLMNKCSFTLEIMCSSFLNGLAIFQRSFQLLKLLYYKL